MRTQTDPQISKHSLREREKEKARKEMQKGRRRKAQKEGRKEEIREDAETQRGARRRQEGPA